MGTQDIAPFVHPAFETWKRFSFGANTVVNQFWRDQIKKDPELSDAAFCIDLYFGGDTIIRIATKTVQTFSQKDGREFHYKGTLLVQPSINYSYSLGSGTSAARSFSFTIPNGLLDAATIISRGRTLAGFGELSLQVDGMDYDKRLVIMRGDMDDGVTFSPGEGGQIEFSLTDPKAHADLNISSWVADATRLETILTNASSVVQEMFDQSVGQRYPVVYNRYVIPVLSLNAETALISAQHLVAYGHNHTINQVTVNSDEKDSSDTEYGFTKLELFDDFGVPVTLIRIDGDATFDGSETIHADVSAGFPDASSLFEIIKSVLRDFTTLGNAGVSDELFALAENKIGASDTRVLINGSGGGTEAKALDFIESELLSSFPMVSMVWDGSGYGPVVTDHRSDLVQFRLKADQFPFKDRVSEIQESPKTSLFNNFTLRYSYDIIKNVYTKVITRHPNNSVLCQISRTNVGERHMDPLESVHIFDDAVANNSIDWMVDHMALPSYYVEHAAYPWALVYLKLGMNIEWSDPEFGWVNVKATVEKLDVEQGNVTVGLRVWFRYYELGGGAINAGG